jgi:1-pyrroline-5-carboxylate dehydrogenase
MIKGFFNLPKAINEPVKNYAPGSAERIVLKAKLQEMQSEKRDIPMFIGGKEVFTDEKINLKQPHKIKHILGSFSRGNAGHVKDAINAALAAKGCYFS